MNNMNMNLPKYSYDQQTSYGNKSCASASASALATSDNSELAAMAVASAGSEASTSSSDILKNFKELDQQACNQQQSQQPQENGIADSLKNLLKMVIQMMMKILGFDKQQNNESKENSISNNPQSPQNTVSPHSFSLQPQRLETPKQNCPVHNQASIPQQQVPIPLSKSEAQQAVLPNKNWNPLSTINGAATSASASASAASASSALDKVDPNELKGIDLSREDLSSVNEKGYPNYLIAKGSADRKYHLYKIASPRGNEYKAVGDVKPGNRGLSVKDPEKNKETAAKANENTSAAASAAASASTSTLNYNVNSGDLTYTTSTASAAAAASASSPGPIENEGGGHTHSPLILDTNKDGKISAQQGMGVDLNNDDKADGAATGGDKMLAMGDINNNGKIDGTEVFGDQTVDPFTGKQINAKNGFEALEKVAKSAEQQTGIKCMDEAGNVDLQKLKQVLEATNKGSLGMISGNNDKKLESLGDAASINVYNYLNQKQSGDVQHNQIGSYQTTSGQEHRVDDVWFKIS